MARKPKCFVIMPYGKKTVGNHELDFDLVWTRLIKHAVTRAGFEPIRADEDPTTSIITQDMIGHICDADIALADITYHNANVFWELGVRHVLAKHGTVLIKREGGELGAKLLKRGRWRGKPALDLPRPPFDIRDIAYVPYDFSEAKLQDAIDAVSSCLIARHRDGKSDSPVYAFIPDLRVSARSAIAPRNHGRTYEILDDSFNPTGKYVGYRSGSIDDCKPETNQTFEYWVNSENTMMQMARIHERAISATIRYRGARDPNPDSPTYEDTIQNLLTERLKAGGRNRNQADEGEVLETDSGRLRETHGVKAILHAAAVKGQAGEGFSPISDPRLEKCVGTIIETARGLIRNQDQPQFHGRRLIMPLLGAGQARRDPTVIAGLLLSAARRALLAPNDLGEKDLNLVAFTAFTRADVAIMRRQCEAMETAKYLRRASGTDVNHGPESG